MDKGYFEVVGTLQADGSIMSMTSIAMGDNLGASLRLVVSWVRVRVARWATTSVLGITGLVRVGVRVGSRTVRWHVQPGSPAP